MTPARVELLDADRAPLLVRRFFESGDPGPIVAALATVPELLEVTMPFVGTALGPGALDAREKEFLILRTSVVLRCRYCVDTHTVVALDSGLSRAEVVAVRSQGSVEVPDARTAALLRWVDEVAAGAGPVPEAVVDEVKSVFAEHELVEMTVVIGATMFLNRLCTALELPVSPATIRRLAEEGFA